MDSSIFLEWFKKFLNIVKERPLLLILDGHASHLSGKLINEARENQVILLKLPAHTTDVLQPLDVACFGPMKRKWQDVLNKMCSLQGTNERLCKATFANELCYVCFYCERFNHFSVHSKQFSAICSVRFF